MITTPFTKQPGIALYYQVEELITSRIQSGKWPVGAQLPSEIDLAQELNISRATVRQAISELVNKGMLIKKHGSGTFVARPSLDTDFIAFSFPQSLGGYHKLQSYKEEVCSPFIAEKLKLEGGTIVSSICQLRLLADERIAGVEQLYMPQEYGFHFANKERPMLNYEFIKEATNIDFTRVDKRIKPIVLDVETASLLNDKVGSPALQLERVYYTYNNLPVYYVQTTLCADLSEYLVIS